MYISSLCLEISMLLQAGITVNHGVDIMLEDEPDQDAKVVLQSLSDNLAQGQPLSEAVRACGYFPNYMVSMVDTGEKSGRLADTLKSLSDHYDRQERLSIAIKNATLYPAVLLGMMIVVVLILIVQVLPIFNDVFGRMGAQMSPFAVQLMQFGEWFRGVSVVIAVVLVALFAVAFLAWAIPAVRDSIVKTFKNKWGGHGIFGRIAVSHFVSSMTIAMSSGLRVDESIGLAAALNSDSQSFNKKYEKCMELLDSGTSLADALRDASILSARDGRILALGDQSGMADSAMAEIARRTERSVQDEIASIVSRIEPTLVIITSVIVGVILLSVMLPLVGIMTSIG